MAYKKIKHDLIKEKIMHMSMHNAFYYGNINKRNMHFFCVINVQNIHVFSTTIFWGNPKVPRQKSFDSDLASGCPEQKCKICRNVEFKAEKGQLAPTFNTKVINLDNLLIKILKFYYSFLNTHEEFLTLFKLYYHFLIPCKIPANCI